MFTPGSAQRLAKSRESANFLRDHIVFSNLLDNDNVCNKIDSNVGNKIDSNVGGKINDSNDDNLDSDGGDSGRTNDNSESTEQTVTSIVASAGPDLIVAAGSTLRYVPLDSSQGTQSFVKILTKHLDFRIEHCLWSPDRQKLCVRGGDEIRVVRFPSGGAFQISDWLGSTSLRCDIIGSALPRSCRPVDAHWHPLSKNSNCLVVLYSDCVLRLFEVDVAADVAQHEIVLFDHETTATELRAFAEDEDEREPSSFCFSNARHGWGSFTAWIAMKSGSLYSLTPVVPLYSICRKQFVQQIALSIQSNDQEDSVDMRLKHRWIADVLGQISSQEIGLTEVSVDAADPTTNLVAFQRPHTKASAPVGPYLFQPSGIDVSTDYTSECDVFSCGCSPVDVLAVSNAAGIIDICLVTSPPDAAFPDAQAKRPNPVLNVYETIDARNGGRCIFIKDPVDTLKLFAQFNSKVLQISFDPWYDSIRTAFEDDQMASTRGILSRQKPSEIETVARSFESDGKIVGCTMLGAPLCDRAILVVYASGRSEVIYRADTSVQQHSEVSRVLQVAYQASPKAQRPLYRPAKPLDTTLSFQSSNSQEALQVTEENLRTMGLVLQSAGDFLTRNFSDILALHAQLLLQLEELKQQRDSVQSAQQKLVDLRSLESRIEGAQQQQEKNSKRLDGLISLILKSNLNALSDAEKEWFRELRRMDAHICRSNGLQARLAECEKKVQQATVQDAHATPGSLPRSSSLSALRDSTSYSRPSQILHFKQYLDKQHAILQHTKQKLQNLQEVLQ